jgi:hypothetical protein
MALERFATVTEIFATADAVSSIRGRNSRRRPGKLERQDTESGFERESASCPIRVPSSPWT